MTLLPNFGSLIINFVGEFFKKALLPFLAYWQGKKNKELEVTKKELEELKKENERNNSASRAKNSINRLSDSDLDSII